MTRPVSVAEPSTAAPVALPVKRRVQRGWGLGLAIIIIAALGTGFAWNKLVPSQPYLAVARPVPVGAQVSADDLITVRISAAPGLTPIPAADQEKVIGKTARVELVAGSLLTVDQLTDRMVPGPGEQLVGLALSKSRIPGQPLRPGDKLLLVATQDKSVFDDPKAPQRTPTQIQATVHQVSKPDNHGDVVVDVIVSDRDGPTVAGLVAQDRIVVVLLPRQ